MTTSRYKGTVTVYRESYFVDRLSCMIKLENGMELYWHPTPKCFQQLIVDGQKNKVDVEVSLTTTKCRLKNPRNVVKLSEPY